TNDRGPLTREGGPMRILFVVVVGVLLGATGCKKKTPPTSQPTDAAATQPTGVRGNTAYVAGGGAAQNVPQAARRTAALKDMHQIALTISQWEIENNRMPNVNEIKSLLASSPNLKKLIDDGDVILTGTNRRDGLWAYEVEADVKG